MRTLVPHPSVPLGVGNARRLVMNPEDLLLGSVTHTAGHSQGGDQEFHQEIAFPCLSLENWSSSAASFIGPSIHSGPVPSSADVVWETWTGYYSSYNLSLLWIRLLWIINILFLVFMCIL